MNINKITSQEYSLNKMLNNIQNNITKPNNYKQMTPDKLTYNLHRMEQACETPTLKERLNNTLLKIAQIAMKANKNDVVGIVYSFLIRTNQNNLPVLIDVEKKALAFAENQKDSLNIAARANELANIYQNTNPNASLNYYQKRKNALKDICANYETIKNNCKKNHRPINTKDAYVFTLIRTEIRLATLNKNLNKNEVKNELVALYKKINSANGGYFVQDLETLNKIKQYLQTHISNITFDINATNNQEKFSIFGQNIINAAKNKEPISRNILSDHIADLYDNFKQEGLEDKFIQQSLDLIEKLNKSNDHIFSSKIYTTLLEKNKDNIENAILITKHGFEQKIKDNDDFGIVYFGQKLSKILRKNGKFYSSEYVNTLTKTIESTKNIINDYNKLSNTNRIPPKNEYIKQLIFDKVNAANVIKHRSPKFFNEILQETLSIIDSLPKDYIAQNPKIESLKKYINTVIETK